MKSIIKKFASLFVVLAILASISQIQVYAESSALIDYINNQANVSSVFEKQDSPVKCTLASCVNMLRRRAYLDGDPTWKDITQSSIAPFAWVPGTGVHAGLVFSFPSNYKNMNIGCAGFSSLTVIEKKTFLSNYLGTHPEGIEVWYPGDSSHYAHAVLLTYYDSSGQTFYCFDPANTYNSISVPNAIIKLADSPVMPGKTQDDKISNLYQYWYITVHKSSTSTPAAISATLSTDWSTWNMVSSAFNSSPLKITTNTVWQVTQCASWITLNPTSGSGSGTLTMYITANTGAARTGTITITAGSAITGTATKMITINQPAGTVAATLSTDWSKWNMMSSAANSSPLKITTNTSWTASSSVSWITISPSYGSGSGTLTMYIAKNNTGSARTGYITIYAGNATKLITINQPR